MNQSTDIETLRDALWRLCGVIEEPDAQKRRSVVGQIRATLKRTAGEGNVVAGEMSNTEEDK